MNPIFFSLEDLNRRYAYCSGIAPEQIAFLSHQGILRIPFYRWDPQRLEIIKQGFLRRKHIFPLYKEVVEFRSVVEYTLAIGDVVTEYCILCRVKYNEQKGKVSFDTDFPFPIDLRVSKWDVVAYPSERLIGKYVEHITWLIIGDEVRGEFLIDQSEN